MNNIILPNFKIDDIYKFDVNSSKFTWFQTGGKIDVLFKPKNVNQLVFFLKNFKEKTKIKVLGMCSNVIIRDGGYDGVVIKLGNEFNYIKKIDNVTIEVGCGTPDSVVAKFAMENNIGGMEFLSSIPGNIGGNLKTNAGCYGSDISSILIEYECVDFNGNILKFKTEDVGFTYRHNPMSKNFVFTKVILHGYKEAKEMIKLKMNEIKIKRELSQPIKNKTGGSTFINPENNSAWKLIDMCGFRGLVLGGAQVSEKHCNFLINTRNATSLEIESLGEIIKSAVFNTYGILLEWEIERIGVFSRNHLEKQIYEQSLC